MLKEICKIIATNMFPIIQLAIVVIYRIAGIYYESKFCEPEKLTSEEMFAI